MKRTGIMLTCLLTAGMLCTWAQADADDPRTPSLSGGAKVDVVVKVKKDFKELKKHMNRVADLLEESEPESAKAIREAVKKAQEAFIAEDMEKVARFLMRGMAIGAMAKGQEVAKELREMLLILERGVMDLDERLERIKNMKAVSNKLKNILGKQRDLQKASRLHADAEKNDSKWREIAADLTDIIKKQKDLKGKSGKIEGDKDVKILADLRSKVRRLIEDQNALKDATTKTPIGKLPVAGEKQKDLTGETAKVRKEIEEAAKDPELAAVVKKAGAPDALTKAAKSVGQAGGEMKKASSALGKSDPKGADSAQEQAISDLEDADKALSDAIEKATGGTKAENLSKKQKELQERTDKLAKDIEEATKQSGLSGKSGKSGPKSANAQQAAGEMGKAAGKLGEQDSKKAVDHQKKAIEKLEDEKLRVADLKEKAKELAREQSLDKQKDKQDKLADQTHKTGEKMNKDPDNPMPGKESVDSAEQNQKQASSKLGKGKSGGASASQKKAGDDLEKAIEDLDEEIAKQEDEAQAEQLEKIDQMLEAALRKQKALSARTKKVPADPKGDTETRKRDIELNELSDGEGKLTKDINKVLDMLVKEGKTVVFPVILREVMADLTKVQNRLTAKKHSLLTQGIQADIEQSIQQMIDAIRKELADRRNKAKGSPPPGGPGGGGGGPLIPPLAELKLLYALQISINRRTVMLDRARTAGELSEPDAKKEHKELAGRQGKVKDLTKTIAGKASPKPRPLPGGDR